MSGQDGFSWGFRFKPQHVYSFHTSEANNMHEVLQLAAEYARQGWQSVYFFPTGPASEFFAPTFTIVAYSASPIPIKESKAKRGAK